MLSRSWLFSLAVALAHVSSAHAYCRTHTDDPGVSGCPEPCPMDGLPIAWPTPRIDYAFNDQGFPGLDDSELRDLIGRSIGTWEKVQCDGKAVGLHAVAEKQTTTLGYDPDHEDPRATVIVHYPDTTWKAHSLPSRAFAITEVRFDSGNGDIVGATMMFNGAMGPFGNCSDFGCTSSVPAADLRNVATHEFGHLLGLSHSAVDGSTMWCDASASEVTKRSLAEDDIDGLCDIYPPGEAFPNYNASSNGCALGTHEGGAWTALALALLLRRRRRTPVQARG